MKRQILVINKFYFFNVLQIQIIIAAITKYIKRRKNLEYFSRITLTTRPAFIINTNLKLTSRSLQIREYKYILIIFNVETRRQMRLKIILHYINNNRSRIKRKIIFLLISYIYESLYRLSKSLYNLRISNIIINSL